MDMEIRLFWIGLGILLLAIIARRFKGKISGDKPVKIYKEVLEWLDTLSWAVLMASVIMYFVIQAFKIPSGSMKSTLDIGDHLFVTKFIYGVRLPFTDEKILPIRKIQRGDIVVFKFPAQSKNDMHYGKDFIKRVVGLPGDKVEVKNKKVYIDGLEIEENYTQNVDSHIYPGNAVYFNNSEYQKAWESGGMAKLPFTYIRDNFGPVVVPENKYFVMGDNRDESYDSRFWGPLDFAKVKGKPLIIYWPLSRIRIIK